MQLQADHATFLVYRTQKHRPHHPSFVDQKGSIPSRAGLLEEEDRSTRMYIEVSHPLPLVHVVSKKGSGRRGFRRGSFQHRPVPRFVGRLSKSSQTPPRSFESGPPRSGWILTVQAGEGFVVAVFSPFESASKLSIVKRA